MLGIMNGQLLNLNDPAVAMVDIHEIAHCLSNLCRWGGRTSRFYSVAEHCCILADFADFHQLGDPFEALMHDAVEAYMGDISNPVKRHLSGVATLDHRLRSAIAQQFDLCMRVPSWVKDLDYRIMADEVRDLIPKIKLDVLFPTNPPVPLGVWIQGLSPEHAKRRFLEKFDQFYFSAERRNG